MYFLKKSLSSQINMGVIAFKTEQILIHDLMHFNCGFIYVLEGSKNNSKQTVLTKLFSDFVPA